MNHYQVDVRVVVVLPMQLEDSGESGEDMGAVSDDMFTDFFARILDPDLGCAIMMTRCASGFSCDFALNRDFAGCLKHRAASVEAIRIVSSTFLCRMRRPSLHSKVLELPC